MLIQSGNSSHNDGISVPMVSEAAEMTVAAMASAAGVSGDCWFNMGRVVWVNILLWCLGWVGLYNPTHSFKRKNTWAEYYWENKRTMMIKVLLSRVRSHRPESSSHWCYWLVSDVRHCYCFVSHGCYTGTLWNCFHDCLATLFCDTQICYWAAMKKLHRHCHVVAASYNYTDFCHCEYWLSNDVVIST